MKMFKPLLPNGVFWFQAATPADLARKLAEQIALILRQRLEAAPRASVALSGGSTPILLFKALAQQVLDWQRIDVVQVDERWVDPSHPDSNSAQIRAHLLQGGAAVARFHPLYENVASPSAGLGAVGQRLESLNWPLDVVVLGMGNDGHTASLFPDAPELVAAMAEHNGSKLAAITPPQQAQARITLTRSAIAGARNCILHIQGDDKLATLSKALIEPDNWAQMPIRVFLRSGLHIFWSPAK
ncbi:6-phosphogluconolactonase [Marinobacter sp. BSs20148]|jgi:6-phosphogluconolactonase|uniref:6-phosphogluconolactonase n=1 Tax=Marinobacter sp. BSs20148 TaxID=490759 RepID=UPI0002777049|nr:6-phosphogluconolactonase [Marinobacter sp. BSs20148]AFP31361.1 6-phosphogluconolactonase [Marinobacter sp. BSs20148]